MSEKSRRRSWGVVSKNSTLLIDGENRDRKEAEKVNLQAHKISGWWFDYNQTKYKEFSKEYQTQKPLWCVAMQSIR